MKFLALATLSLLVSCANSPLGSMVNTHPSIEDVDQMKIGQTTRKEVDEKFSGASQTIMNGNKCLTFFKPSLIGEATKTTFLCFDDKNLLVQKFFQ